MRYDVFNGDADGIFALHQLRLETPLPDAALITGVKRDINLLAKIDDDAPDGVTVLDISLDKNRTNLLHLLKKNCEVLYVDHHFAGNIPENEKLTCHIKTDAEHCTSLIVNEMLKGKYPLWAACGAFGDNLHEQATAIARQAGADDAEIAILQEMGELFNYNGYGASLDDLHFHPADLFVSLSSYDNPLDYIADTEILEHLRQGHDDDMSKAMSVPNISERPSHRIYSLPNESWARRVSGVYSNRKAREREDAAHAIIVTNEDGTLMISVRAPLTSPKDADTLCRKFPTGGGRAAAAGINQLPSEMLAEFIETFYLTFSPHDMG